MAKEPSMSSADLRLTVQRLSNEAFGLAKSVVDGTGTQEERVEQARALGNRLRELWPLIQKAPASDRPTVSSAYSEGQLDLNYVLSEGKLPTSIRLHHYLAEQGQQG